MTIKIEFRTMLGFVDDGLFVLDADWEKTKTRMAKLTRFLNKPTSWISKKVDSKP